MERIQCLETDATIRQRHQMLHGQVAHVVPVPVHLLVPSCNCPGWCFCAPVFAACRWTPRRQGVWPSHSQQVQTDLDSSGSTRNEASWLPCPGARRLPTTRRIGPGKFTDALTRRATCAPPLPQRIWTL